MITIPKFMPKLEERKFTDVVLEFNFAVAYAQKAALYLHAVEEQGLFDGSREHIGFSYTPVVGDDDLFEGACDQESQHRRLRNSQVADSIATRLDQDPILGQRLAVICSASDSAVREVVRFGIWKYRVDLTPADYNGTSIEAPYHFLKNLGIVGTFAGFKDPDKTFQDRYLVKKRKKSLFSLFS